MVEHLLAAPVAQGRVVRQAIEDLGRVGGAPQAGARLGELLADLFDDLETHGVQLVGGVGRRRVEPSQGQVHLVASGQEADAGMVVVTGGRQHFVPKRIPVGRQRGADDLVDGGGDFSGEPVLLHVGPREGTNSGIADHEIQLHDRAVHQSADGRPACCGALPVPRGRRGQHVGNGAQTGEVAPAPLLGVEGHLGQHGQHAADRCRKGVAHGELDSGHGGGIGHLAAQDADEVEGLPLGLAQAFVRRLLGAGGDRSQLVGLVTLGRLAEVGEAVVVTGKSVERSAQRVSIESSREQFGGEVVGGHRLRVLRA